jgi:ferredoxin
MSGRRVLDSGYRLEIDRIACDAYGTCAELLPEGIDLDEWGYPVLAPGNVPAHLLDLAKRAVDGCPVLALRLVKAAGANGVAAAPPPPVLAARRPETRPDRMEGTPPWPPRPANRPAKRGPEARRRR